VETIECKFCGNMISATATECEHCGGGTPYGLLMESERTEVEAVSAARAVEERQTFEYRMFQIPPNVTVKQKDAKGDEAALYLQRIVNEQARQGWEFVRVDTIGVQTEPGCLGSLLGAQATMFHYYVVTFRRRTHAGRLSAGGEA
jgi:predicted GNAT family acetyltransferase